MMTGISFTVLLWGAAFVAATAGLIRLSVERQKELRGKLDVYVASQAESLKKKRAILAELERRRKVAESLSNEPNQGKSE